MNHGLARCYNGVTFQNNTKKCLLNTCLQILNIEVSIFFNEVSGLESQCSITKNFTDIHFCSLGNLDTKVHFLYE